MVLVIDITIFGYTLFPNVQLIERNVAYSIIIAGFILKLLLTNINARTEDTKLLDIFAGQGFTDIFKGKFSYLFSPIKHLFLLKGSLFSLLIVLVAAYFFPLVGPEIVDLASFRSFLFIALTTGYSSDLLVQQIREQLSGLGSIAKLVKEVIQLVSEERA